MTKLVLVDFHIHDWTNFRKLKEKFIKQEKGLVNWLNNALDMKSGKLVEDNYLKIEYLFDRDIVLSQITCDNVSVPDCFGWKTNVEFVKKAALKNYRLVRDRLVMVTDEDIWRNLVETYHCDDFGDEMTSKKDFMTFCIEKMIFKAEYFASKSHESFRNDKEIVRSVYLAHVITRTYHSAGFSDTEYTGKPFDIMENETYLNSHLSIVETLRNDPNFILDCVKRFGRVLAFIDLKYRSDRNYVLEAIRQIDDATYCYHNGLLRFASDELRNDREVVKVAVENWTSCFEFASDNLRRNEEFISELISLGYGRVLDYADVSVRNNIDLLLLGLDNYEGCFELFDERLQNDREFVLKCAKINGDIRVSERFFNDREIIKALLGSCLRKGVYLHDFLNSVGNSLIMNVEFVKELVDMLEEYPEISFPTHLYEYPNEEIIWKVIQQNARKKLMKYTIYEQCDIWKDPLFVTKVLDLGIKLSKIDYSPFNDDLKLRIWKNTPDTYQFPFTNSSVEVQREALRLRPECIANSFHYFSKIIPELSVEFGFCFDFKGDRQELLKLREKRLEYLQFYLPRSFDTW